MRMQLRHDPTYFVATRCLPRERRSAVHALYGYVRGADEIADDQRRNGERRAALDAWQAELEHGLERGHSEHPIIAALVDAGPRHGMPLELIPQYMDSMRADCDDPVRMRSQDQLERYMDGTATVGPLIAPLLDAPAGVDGLLASLGVAFQLTNFIRDIGEDHGRGRIYLPQADLARFGVSEDLLARAVHTGVPSPPVRSLVAFEVRRAVDLYVAARPGLTMVDSRCQPCLELAFTLYRRILHRVISNDFNVFEARLAVPRWQRLATAGHVAARAAGARAGLRAS